MRFPLTLGAKCGIICKDWKGFKMGWSHGVDTNRKEGDQDIGYGVAADCDEAECAVEIDRGLGYICGGDPYGGESGCGRFFCAGHLDYYFTNDKDEIMSPQLCVECGKLYEANGGA